MKKVIGFAALVCVLCVAMTGCTSFFSSGLVKGFSGSEYGTKMNAHFSYFNGDRGAYIPLKQGDTISITYNLTCTAGTMTLTFEDKDGNLLFTNADAIGTGEVTADATQTYTLRLTGVGAQGSYAISWEVKKAGS
ncbi:MAG: hypothetical protein FWF49_02075 [Oscillospiraceae bacterium]|nr:hypothetical protein [Oscillospiraceae bacterium]